MLSAQRNSNFSVHFACSTTPIFPALSSTPPPSPAALAHTPPKPRRESLAHSASHPQNSRPHIRRRIEIRMNVAVRPVIQINRRYPERRILIHVMIAPHREG